MFVLFVCLRLRFKERGQGTGTHLAVRLVDVVLARRCARRVLTPTLLRARVADVVLRGSVRFGSVRLSWVGDGMGWVGLSLGWRCVLRG